jgi:hypothetical protein
MFKYICLPLIIFFMLSLDANALDLDPAKALINQERELIEKDRKKRSNIKKDEIEHRKRKKACLKIRALKVSQNQKVLLSQEWQVPIRSIQFVKSKYKRHVTLVSGRGCVLLFDTARGVKEIVHSQFQLY